MTITAYISQILPDYSRAFSDVASHLSGCVNATYDIKAVNVGANAFRLTFPATVDFPNPRVFNYANIGGKYYFLTEWVQDNPNAFTTLAVFDWWHNSGTIYATGTLTSAHDLGDILALRGNDHTKRYGTIAYPIDIVCGQFVSSANYANDQWNDKVCAVANITIKDGSYLGDILIYSKPCSLGSEYTTLMSYIGGISKASKISTAKSYDIASINGMWVIPSFLISSGSTITNATLLFDHESYTSIGVFWDIVRYRTNFTLGDSGLPRSKTSEGGVKYPVFLKAGNMDTNLTVPLDTLYSDVRLNCLVDSAAAYIGMFLVVGDKRVDLLPSLSIHYPARRVEEPELSANIANAVQGLSSVLSIAAGVATGNPIAIAAGVGSAAQTAASVASQITVSHTAVSGHGLLNLMPYSQTSLSQFPQTLNGFGILQYSIANEAELTDVMRRYGYTGAVYVDSFPVNGRPVSTIDPNFVYNATFRKFDANAALDFSASETLTTDGREALREILTRGITIYHTQRIQIPAVNWDVSLPSR